MFKRRLNSLLALLVCLFTMGVSASCIPISKPADPASIEDVQRVSHSQDETHSDFDYERMSYQEAIEAVSNPKGVLDYYKKHLSEDDGENSDKINSFKKIHETRRGMCGDYATAAAALLSDDGYGSTIVYLWDLEVNRRHVIYIYKENGRFGSIGMNKDDIREAIYDSVEDIIGEYYLLYRTYLIIDFDSTMTDWRTTDKALNFIYLKKDAKKIEAN